MEIPKPLGAIQVAWAKKVLGLNFRARDLKTAGGDGQGRGENRRNPRGSPIFDGHLGNVPMFRHSEVIFFW